VGKREYDFAGWVTKNDIQCSDGVTIKHDAFKANDGQRVPLVWNHNYDNPKNVLGHIILHNKEGGVYGYGYFNDTEEGQSAKLMVKHGDLSSLSIGARKIQRSGNNVVHGNIYEVSLVLSGANPGALIDTVVKHSDGGVEEESAVVYTGTLIHSADDILDIEEGGESGVKKEDDKKDNLQHADEDKTLGDVFDTMTDEQKDAVYALLGAVADSGVEDEEIKQSDKESGEELKQSDDKKGDGEIMKQNVFQGTEDGKKEETLKHSYAAALKLAQQTKASSLKDLIAAQGDDSLKHGINSIEMLFPDAAQSTNGNTPILYKDPNTAYLSILNGVSKSPFSRVKTVVADLTEDEARAKGYIKGNMKKEEFFSLIKRKTDPTTVYKKQKLDRDDIIDITDFDVVAFMNVEMQMMLKEEIARAILVGDGRDFSDEDKIDEQHIRPIIGDNEFFTIQKSFTAASAFVEAVIKAMAEYRGSGMPDMFIDQTLLADVKLLKGTDGRYLFGDIPSNEAVANRLGLNSIVPTTFMTGKGAVIVNLRDYQLGASKGGQITSFDDFDIDFNQYKYLIETRLSGALTLPKSAIHLVQGTAATGADATKAGLTYGERQADKTTEEPTV
jgi:HK97 family phage prohead protease